MSLFERIRTWLMWRLLTPKETAALHLGLKIISIAELTREHALAGLAGDVAAADQAEAGLSDLGAHVVEGPGC